MLVTVFCAGIAYFTFTLYNAPAPTETLEVFFAGKVKDRAICDEWLESTKKYGVLTVGLNSAHPSDSAFPTKYSVVAVNGCDIVIVPESVADQTDCANTFTPITGYENAYTQNGVAYGAMLGAAAKEALEDKLQFDEGAYFVFIVASSVNSGGEALTDNAVKLFDIILNYGKTEATT